MSRPHIIRAALVVAILVTAARPALAAAPTADCSGSTARPAILLDVSGLKQRRGLINVFVYGGVAKDFLVRDKRIQRLQYRVSPTGPNELCIALSKAGRNAIAIHHDINMNDKRDISDGIGFSGNPGLSMMRLKPTYAQSSFLVGNSVRRVTVIAQYRAGLSIKPIAPSAR